MDLFNAALSAIKSLRIQDVLDIAIIAIMLFAFFIWFKNRASRFVLIGIILLGGVYRIVCAGSNFPGRFTQPF